MHLQDAIRSQSLLYFESYAHPLVRDAHTWLNEKSTAIMHPCKQSALVTEWGIPVRTSALEPSMASLPITAAVCL